MEIRAIGDGGFGVECFADTEIECQLRDDLPPQSQVSPSAHAIDCRHGESIEYVVLVAIDAIGPLASIEPLETAVKR